MTENQTDSLTLDEIRDRLAPLIPAHAAFDGWSDDAVRRAAQDAGVDRQEAALAFSDGPMQMIDAWFAHIDAAMAGALPAEEMEAMPVHKRIRAAIVQRIEIARPHKEALRRALAILAMPQNAAKAARLSWRSSDAMWRLAGDTATDYNHYTKRMILSGVYGSTILAWLDDESDDEAETMAFLDRRLGNVAQFEKFKSKLRGDPDRRFSISRFLGRLRYPAR
ncbi:MAG: COQ9 family protein [Sphingomonadaceae bacterium]|nr:COQ9 family protein [Sphingomonadaceae bacterium]